MKVEMGQGNIISKDCIPPSIMAARRLEWFDKKPVDQFTYMEAYREKAIALIHMNRYAEALAVL